MTKFKQFLQKFIAVFGLIVFSCIFITAYFGIMQQSWDSQIPLFIVPFCTTAIIVLSAVFLKNINRLKISGKSIDITFIVCLIGSAVLQMCFCRFSGYQPFNDSNVIEKAARAFAEDGNFKDMYRLLPDYNIGYFDRLPNNWGTLVYVSLAYRIMYLIFGFVPYTAGYILNVFSLAVNFAFAYFNIKLLFEKNSTRLAGLIAMFIHPVFLLYSPVMYSDTISMPFAQIALFLFLKALKQDSFQRFCLFAAADSLVLTIAYQLKGSLVVMIVAFVISIFIKCDLKKTLCFTAAILVVFLGGTSLFKSACYKMQISTPEKHYEQSVPTTHYIMMGLKDRGGFSQKDYSNTLKQGNLDEKKAYNIAVIKERLKEYGLRGFLLHMQKKVEYTWSDGRFYSHYQLSHSDNKTLVQRINSGKFAVIANSIHLAMLSFMLVSFANGIFRSSSLSLIRLMVLGIILLLMIWETRSRYLINFMPMYIFLALDGLNSIKPKNKINIKEY